MTNRTDADGIGISNGDTAPWVPDQGPSTYEQFLTMPQIDSLSSADDAEPGDLSDRETFLDVVAGQVINGHVATANHDLHMRKANEERVWRNDPLKRLVDDERDLIGLADDVEDELDAYFGADSPRNVGYWRSATLPPRQACEQLCDELLAFLRPTPVNCDRGGSFLAIADGVQGLSSKLRRLWPSAELTSIECSPGMRQRKPLHDRRGRKLEYWDEIARLQDGTFDLVTWIEGLDVPSRQDCLRQAGRLLKPGGRFLAADLVGSPADRVDSEPFTPGIDVVLEHYKNGLEEASFGESTVVDISRTAWWRFYRHSRHYFATKVLCQQIDQNQYNRILTALPGGGRAVAAYLLVSATKNERLAHAE